MSEVLGIEKPKMASGERMWLPVVLTVIEVVMFFGFIFISAFSPATLGATIAGSSVNWAFVYGMVILVVSVLLIGLSVQIENKGSA
jgi:uncharacterized membrane protein (DUF485 family)